MQHPHLSKTFSRLAAAAALFFVPFTAAAQSASVSEVPCQGITIWEEDFDSGLDTAQFTVLDLDGRTPFAGLGMTAGWQGFADFTDAANGIAASPSWYDSAGVSDDWLILPQLSISTTNCFSWRSTSVDDAFPESYEVRISTTTPDTAGFFAHPPLDTVNEENEAWTWHSLNMSAYAGQNIYIAFRQISYDKFVLGLDDLRLADIENLDVKMWSAFPHTADTNKLIHFFGSVVNCGADVLTSVTVSYQIDGGAVISETFDSISIPMNHGYDYYFINSWNSPDTAGLSWGCYWTSAPNAGTDGMTSNDTVCHFIGVGGAIAVQEPLRIPDFELYPNPATDEVTLQCTLPLERVQMMDMSGRVLREYSGGADSILLNVRELPAGLYLVQGITPDGSRFSKRLLKQ